MRAGAKKHLQGVIRTSADLPAIASVLPQRRFRLINRLRSRFWLGLGSTLSNQFTLFLSELDRLFQPFNIFVIDASLWFDGGKLQGSPYHNDVWLKAPLDNRILQLWIPLMAEGTPEEIAASMVRLDPQPLGDDWACGSGTNEFTNIHTGEVRPLEFDHYHGVPNQDLEGVLGGGDLAIGDVLYFDNAFCHYSLPSRAKRVGLAVRLSCGAPIYNGYFDSPKPLDRRTYAEPQRLAWKRAIGFTHPGGEVSPAALREPYGAGPILNLASFLLLFDGRRRLDPILEFYAAMIAAKIGTEAGEL